MSSGPLSGSRLRTSERGNGSDDATRRLVQSQIENFFAAIETIGGHMVTAMRLTSRGIDRQRRLAQRIVRATLIASRSAFSVLLYRHLNAPLVVNCPDSSILPAHRTDSAAQGP